MSEAPPRTDLPEDPRGNGGPGREWGAVLVRLFLTVGLLGLIYTGVAFYFKDRPQVGVSVAGVDIGSLTKEEATARVERAVADMLEQPFILAVETDAQLPGEDDAAASSAEATDDDGGDRERDSAGQHTDVELVPAQSGLGYDIEATLDGVTGLSFHPRDLWGHLSGAPRELTLIGTVDEPVLRAALIDVAEDFDQEAVEGEVSLVPEGVRVVDAEPGRALDIEQAVEAVQEAWPGDQRASARAAVILPALTQAEVERFTSQELEPAIAGPVSVTATFDAGGEADQESVTAQVQPREIVDLLDIERTDDSLSLTIDEDALLSRLRQDLGQLERGPRDATVRWDGSRVRTVPATVGGALDHEDLVEVATEAIRGSGPDREVSVDLEVIEPQIPTAAASSWVFEEMGSFASVYPTGPDNAARTKNLQAGARNVDGTVIMPGGQFSLAAALGDISAASGYVEAPVIMDGRLVMGLGGGLSQLSTVVFNTSWFSGVQLDQHTPHSFYIARYPAGREATLAVPVLDNRWTNNTDNPIVVRAWTADDTLHMTYLGKKVYEVETIDGQWRNIVEPESSTDDSPDCVPQNPAQGFTITNVRVLRAGGQVAHRDEFTTTYIPADEIVCTGR